MKRWLEKRSQKQQERLLLRLKTDPFLFLEIKDPTEEMKLALVRCRGRYLDFVKHPSERVCFEAVRTFPKAIQEANNHYTLKVCLEAVKQEGTMVIFIPDTLTNQDQEELLLEAFRKDPYVIHRLKDADLVHHLTPEMKAFQRHSGKTYQDVRRLRRLNLGVKKISIYDFLTY